MTNVSAVEKMAKLMQQMEENSPRVTALQYCLKLVGNKLEEAEKRISELETKCAALAAENAVLKKSDPAPFSKLMMEALDVYQAGADEVPELAMLSAYKKLRDGLKTPATDAFLAEVRASGVEMVIAAKKHQKGIMHTDTFAYGAAQESLRNLINELELFAAQLRQEAAQ